MSEPARRVVEAVDYGNDEITAMALMLESLDVAPDDAHERLARWLLARVLGAGRVFVSVCDQEAPE